MFKKVSNCTKAGSRHKKVALAISLVFLMALMVTLLMPQSVFAYTMSNSYFNITTGTNGEISSLMLSGDAFATNYVMNASNAPNQNTSGHEWLG